MDKLGKMQQSEFTDTCELDSNLDDCSLIHCVGVLHEEVLAHLAVVAVHDLLLAAHHHLRE